MSNIGAIAVRSKPACASTTARFSDRPAASLVDLACSMASPVARRLLPGGCAEAELLAASLRAERAGQIQVDPIDYAAILQHIMWLNVRNLVAAREVAEWRIQRRVAPLVATQAPSHRIFVAAHDANGDSGFEFRGWEIQEIVAAAMIAEAEGAA